MEPTLCPLCGVGGTLKLYGDLVECDNCGAEARFRPDPNLFPLERAHDPLREALLWKHSAGELIWTSRQSDVETIEMATAMMQAARSEVERLLAGNQQ